MTWDAGKLPVLWVHGEFGTTKEQPYHDRFYTLALQPMSRNPYPRSTTLSRRRMSHHFDYRQTNGWTSATLTALPGPAICTARARYSG